MQYVVDGRIKISFSWEGEGYYGDFDSNNPEDKKLYRFTIYKDFKEKESRCTQLVVGEDEHCLSQAISTILETTKSSLKRGKSIKKLSDELSWMDNSWFQDF